VAGIAAAEVLPSLGFGLQYFRHRMRPILSRSRHRVECYGDELFSGEKKGEAKR
jgi:hypothetical protein